MSKNYLENLFDYVKSLGLHKEYKDYSDFKAQKYGEGKTDEEKQQQIENDYELFKSELPPEELKDYLYVFGD